MNKFVTRAKQIDWLRVKLRNVARNTIRQELLILRG